MREKINQPEKSSYLEGWDKSKKILVILAHPDDPEFFCGAMIARWHEMGHEVNYCLLTRGQRGSDDANASPLETGEVRVQEQREAGDVLGVNEIVYLDFMDGELFADLELRNAVIKQIRKQRPDVVVTSDPRTYFTSPGRINHPDHRAAGLAVFEGVFPAAGNPSYKVEDDFGIELPPHQVEELWLTLTHMGDTKVELTRYFALRKEALFKHRSQIRETREVFEQRLASKLVKNSNEALEYFETFCRIKLV